MKPGILVWSRMTRRSRDIATVLGINLYHICDRPPYLRAWRETPKIFEEAGGRTSCIILQLPPGPAVLRATMIKERPRLICDSHTGMFHYRNIKDWILNRPFRSRLSKCDVVLVHNEESRRLLESLIDKPRDGIHVVYDPIPPVEDIEKPEMIIPERYILLPVAWEADEDILGAVEGFARSRAPGRGYRLIITGDYNKNKKIYNKILNNYNDIVMFTGYIPYKNYMWLIKNTELVIALTNWEYTLLSVIWEAAKYSKPISYPSTNTFKNLFSNAENQSLMYDKDNPVSISQVLDYVIENTERTREQGRRIAEKLTRLSRESMERLRDLCNLSL